MQQMQENMHPGRQQICTCNNMQQDTSCKVVATEAKLTTCARDSFASFTTAYGAANVLLQIKPSSCNV